jgi:prepilin-type N-terminal cleavage/methylation domain-containing protein
MKFLIADNFRTRTYPRALGMHGFTLIELLIVVAIIGILAGIAVPTYLGERKKAMHQEALSNLQSLRLLEEQYFAENGCYYRVGTVCTDATINTTLNAGKVVFAAPFLPRFRPGDDLSLRFTYSITTTTANGAVATAFRAIATGKPGSPVAGSIFCIDQDNSSVCP